MINLMNQVAAIDADMGLTKTHGGRGAKPPRIPMLSGFPKQVTTTKLGRGHYRIDREDGYSIEVRTSNRGGWYQVSNMVRRKSLSVFQLDMERGYMPRDQLSESYAAAREKYGD